MAPWWRQVSNFTVLPASQHCRYMSACSHQVPFSSAAPLLADLLVISTSGSQRLHIILTCSSIRTGSVKNERKTGVQMSAMCVVWTTYLYIRNWTSALHQPSETDTCLISQLTNLRVKPINDFPKLTELEVAKLGLILNCDSRPVLFSYVCVYISFFGYLDIPLPR